MIAGLSFSQERFRFFGPLFVILSLFLHETGSIDIRKRIVVIAAIMHAHTSNCMESEEEWMLSGFVRMSTIWGMLQETTC